jgi:hypothetical protein
MVIAVKSMADNKLVAGRRMNLEISLMKSLACLLLGWDDCGEVRAQVAGLG